MILICDMPKDWKPGDFDPFPGGQGSRKLGCSCPYQPFETGKIEFDSDCKIHTREWIAQH